MALLTKRGDSDRQHSAHKTAVEGISLNKDTLLKAQGVVYNTPSVFTDTTCYKWFVEKKRTQVASQRRQENDAEVPFIQFWLTQDRYYFVETVSTSHCFKYLHVRILYQQLQDYHRLISFIIENYNLDAKNKWYEEFNFEALNTIWLKLNWVMLEGKDWENAGKVTPETANSRY